MTATAQEDARGLACGPVVVQSGVGQVCKCLCACVWHRFYLRGNLTTCIIIIKPSSLLFKRAVILARPAFGARNMVPVIPGRRENNKTKQSVILHWFVHERWSFFLLLLRFHMCSFSLSLCVCLHAGVLRFIGLPHTRASINQPLQFLFWFLHSSSPSIPFRHSLTIVSSFFPLNSLSSFSSLLDEQTSRLSSTFSFSPLLLHTELL